MDSSIVRATVLLAAGIFVGLVIGLTISPARRAASTVVQASDGGSAATANLKAKSGARLESEMQHPNILLGDIVTVPFQELYGVLSALSPQQLNELAAQLKKFTRWQRDERQGCRIF